MCCACRARKRTLCAERRTTSHPKSSSKLVRLNAFLCRQGPRSPLPVGRRALIPSRFLGAGCHHLRDAHGENTVRHARRRLCDLPQGTSPSEVFSAGWANRGFTRCAVQVMKGVFECPDDMSPGAASLIRGLCTKDVSKRLGRLANGADDLRNHPWYTDAQFDWVSVLHPPASPLRRADFLSAAAAAAAVSGDAAALRARCEGRRGHLLFCGRGRLGRGGPVGMAERFAAD